MRGHLMHQPLLQRGLAFLRTWPINAQFTPAVNSPLMLERVVHERIRFMLSKQQKADMGGRIERAIEGAGKNQAWLARELGVTPAHISKMCKTGSVSLDMLAQICLLLGASMDWIVFGKGTKLPRASEEFAEKFRELLTYLPEPIKPK